MSPLKQYGFELTQAVLACAFDVHSALGAGLLENAYEQCLAYDLKAGGFDVQQQVMIDIHYKELVVANAFKADLIVNDVLIIELKTVEKIAPIHEAQIINYLHLAQKPLGLLLNFKQSSLKNGIKRYYFDQYREKTPLTPLNSVVLKN